MKAALQALKDAGELVWVTVAHHGDDQDYTGWVVSVQGECFAMLLGDSYGQLGSYAVAYCDDVRWLVTDTPFNRAKGGVYPNEVERVSRLPENPPKTVLECLRRAASESRVVTVAAPTSIQQWAIIESADDTVVVLRMYDRDRLFAGRAHFRFEDIRGVEMYGPYEELVQRLIL